MSNTPIAEGNRIKPFKKPIDYQRVNHLSTEISQAQSIPNFGRSKAAELLEGSVGPHTDVYGASVYKRTVKGPRWPWSLVGLISDLGGTLNPMVNDHCPY